MASSARAKATLCLQREIPRWTGTSWSADMRQILVVDSFFGVVAYDRNPVDHTNSLLTRYFLR